MKKYLVLTILFITSLCQESTSAPSSSIPSNCKIINYLSSCIECADNYIPVNQGHECIIMDHLKNKMEGCKIFSKDDASICEECEEGLILAEGKNMCLTNEKQEQIVNGLNASEDIKMNPQSNEGNSGNSGIIIISQKDKNCRIPGNLAGSLCKACYFGYYYDKTQNVCVSVNPLCKTWNSDGHCTDCWGGYTLVNTECVLSSQASNCFKFVGGQCSICSFRYYFNEDHVCTAVNERCQQWYLNSGECYNCFPGFILNNQTNFCQDETIKGDEAIQNDQKIIFIQSDTKFNVLNCNKYDSDGDCVKCSWKHFLFNSTCEAVDDLCLTWDESTGGCTTCFQGYRLDEKNQQCLAPDPFCIDFKDNICVECLDRYYLNEQNKCLIVNTDCLKLSEEGECIQCYPKVKLIDGKCLL